MKKTKTPAEVTSPGLAEPPVRRPGRPPANSDRNINRILILRAALRLAKTMPLHELSILTVARSMNIAPGLVHYYVGGRDWLTSGVINLFYSDLVKRWPSETGNWEADLLDAARVIFNQFTKYGGIASYVVTHSRFRIFQITTFSDRDWGVELLERFAGRVHAAKLPAERSAVFAHLFFEFIINTAHGTVRHLFPAESKKFLEEKTAQLDEAKYPNIFYGHDSPLRLDGQVVFEELCLLILLGIKQELFLMEEASTNKRQKSSKSKL